MNPAPEIFDAASDNLERDVNLIEASAGTGKTYAIAMLVLRLVTEYSLKIEDILLVTFTRAATEELAERIRGRLVEARDLLANRFESEDQTLLRWAARIADKRQALQMIEEALLEIDRTPVFTIHGFCQRMLMELALESGQIFDTELQPDVREIYKNIAEDYWRHNIYSLAERPCSVILAHYSSPEKLYSSIAPLSNHLEGIEPQAGSIKEGLQRFSEAYQELASWWLVHADSLFSDIKKLVADGKMKKGFAESFTQWHQALCDYFDLGKQHFPEKIAWLRSIDFAEQINGSKVRGAKREWLLSELNLPDELVSSFLGSIDDLLLHVRCDFARYILSECEERMSKRGIVSYDDLIVRLHRAVANPESELRTILGNRFKAALIDEFQDTDALQWRIFNTIFGGRNHFLYLIGDPKQAIYRFRGADIHSYFLAKKAAGHHLTLLKNYRSHPNLVMEVNALFHSRQEPFLYGGDKLPFQPVDPAKTAKDGSLLEESAPLNNMIYCQLEKAVESADGKWTVSKASAAIMRYVAGEIVHLLQAPVSIRQKDEKRLLRPADIAILVRKNSQAEEYQKCLAGFGVTSVIASKTSVFKSEESNQLYHVLKAVANPGDTELLKRAMAVSWFGLSGNDLYRIIHDELIFDKYHSRFHTYAESWPKNGVLVMMKQLLKDEEVFLHISGGDFAERKITNIHHLLELLQQAETDNIYGPLQLLQWLRRNIDSDSKEEELRLESDDEAVRIITMHGSKGLEYPVVFCPVLWYRQARLADEKLRISCHEDGRSVLDLGSKRFEQRRKQAEFDEMAEELRLLYVAVTRAQLRCYTVWCDIGGRTKGPTDSFDSGLGYLLFPEGRASFSRQCNVLEKKSASPGVEYVLIENNAEIATYLWTGRAETETLSSRKFARESLHTDYQITSYSALAAGSRYDAVEAKSVSSSFTYESSDEIGLLPAGAQFGNAVHDIFETLPFQALLQPEQHRTVIEESCQRYGVELEVCHLEKMLKMVVTYPVGTMTGMAEPFTLSDLDDEKCLKEMGFYFHLKSGNTANVNAILASEKTVIPLTEKRLKGYLTGYVDLIFQHNGVFFIADYKTNNLGSCIENYQGELLTEAMASHNYGLQFWLYALVLHRHLRNILSGYDYDKHFGGIFYLFVRGMKKVPNGVFFQKPDLSTLERLGSCFGGER